MVGIGINVGERLHKAVFVVTGQREKMSSSSLAQQTAVSSCRSLPTAEEITAHCPAYVSQYSSDLHMLVWIMDLGSFLPIAWGWVCPVLIITMVGGVRKLKLKPTMRPGDLL